MRACPSCIRPLQGPRSCCELQTVPRDAFSLPQASPRRTGPIDGLQRSPFLDSLQMAHFGRGQGFLTPAFLTPRWRSGPVISQSQISSTNWRDSVVSRAGAAPRRPLTVNARPRVRHKQRGFEKGTNNGVSPHFNWTCPRGTHCYAHLWDAMLQIRIIPYLRGVFSRAHVQRWLRHTRRGEEAVRKLLGH
mgnify:CR=1 FL=1|jgi:hypothetical protein